MSKVKININYNNNQQTTKIQQFQKGPIVYDNLYSIYHSPHYQNLQVQGTQQNDQIDNTKKGKMVQSNVQVLKHYKSEQNLYKIKPTQSAFINQHNQKDLPQTTPVQSLVAINTKFVKVPENKIENNVVLNKGNEVKNIIETKKPAQHLLLVNNVLPEKGSQGSQIRNIIQNQVSREMSIDKDSNQKNKLIPKKQQITHEIKSQPKKNIMIQQISQSEFKVNPVLDPFSRNIITSLPDHYKKPEQIKKTLNPNDIVLKAPSFKQVIKNTGQSTLKNSKRQYIKGEGQQKYLYNGIPQKQESDFMGCFGCCRPKPKAFSVDRRQNR